MSQAAPGSSGFTPATAPSLTLSHSASAYGQCSIQSPGDLRAIQQFYDFTIFMQRSTI